MPEITFQEAKQFLENISNEDKVAIIHHDDGDGFCSGILYYDYSKSKGAQTEHFAYSIGKSSLEKLDLQKFNKVIICDLAPDFMAEELESIKNKQILYADHHPRSTPIPKEIFELITTDRGYIPSSRTAGELTNLKLWLALTGTITDAGDLHIENQEFIDKQLKEIGMNLDEFKEKASSIITNFLIYFNKDTNEAFEELEKINSIEELEKLKKYSEPIENEIQKFIEEYETKKEKLGETNFYYFEPHFSIKSIVANIISQQNNNEAFIFATPKNETDKITLSARSQNDSKNMSDILKVGIEDLPKARAGGHRRAAGGIILAKDIEKFKKNIRKFVEQ